MSLMGIDVGTSGCKASVFREDGTCLSEASCEYHTEHPHPGWAVVNSQALWTAAQQVISKAAAGVAASDPVRCLSVTSRAEAMVAFDRQGNMLGDSILSSDLRGQEYVDQLLLSIPADQLYAINPNVAGVNYTLPKLCWWRDHLPDLYRQTDVFCCWAEAIAVLLGAPPHASPSLANRTMFFDLAAQDWSDRILNAVGLDREKLPPIRPSGSSLGRVSPGVADALGLRRDVEMIVGGHDQCANALGAGIIADGQAVDGIGTFECITPVFTRLPDFESMRRNGLNIEDHFLPGSYVCFIYNQAGSLLKWFRRTLAKDMDGLADAYSRLDREMPSAPTDLLVLPYFEITGPPRFEKEAAGVIAGLTTATTRGEMFRAMLESITYYFADVFPSMRSLGIHPDQIIATGGGAKSDAWLQMKADILGIPYTRPVVTESGTLGMAMLAGVSTGVYGSIPEAVETVVRIERSFEPDAGRHAEYAERLDRYRKLSPVLLDYYHHQQKR